MINYCKKIFEKFNCYQDDTICSKFADCIDIETGMEEYEFTEKPEVEYARKEAMELEIVMGRKSLNKK